MFYVKDPEMIKQVTIRDFDHFQDGGFFAPEISRMEVNNFGLGNLSGDHWKSVKASISPAFRLKNMKAMVPSLDQISKQLIKHIADSFQSGQLNLNEVELDPLIRAFGMDVITQVAFGIRVDAIKNPDNEFTKFAGDLFSMSRLMLSSLFPSIAAFFNIGIVHKDILDFFFNVSRQILKERQDINENHNDILDLMIKIRNKTLKTDHDEEEFGLRDAKKNYLDDETIAKTMMQFFMDGYDTMAGAITLCLYFLACNQDVQEKARQEVEEIAFKCQGISNGDDINKLKYLDMVFAETLRFTPMPYSARLCTKDWTVPGTDVVIPKNTRVFMPVAAIHMDSKFHPNPEKFDPDRFSPERKGEMVSGTYLPFGIGPRQCLGMALARLETKILLFHILKSFNLEPCDKTQIPLECDPSQFIKILGGCWLKLVPRHNT